MQLFGDALEDTLMESKQTLRSSCRASQDAAENAFFQKASLEGKLAAYVELLKFKNLSIGMKIWCVILEVTSRSLTLSLPHGLRAHVAANEVRLTGPGRAL